MGWLILIAFRPLADARAAPGLGLAGGGRSCLYRRRFFFVSKRSRYTHFVWHLFVLLGTACHFLAVLTCAAA